MDIIEYLKNRYLETLENSHEKIKSSLNEKNFVPDRKEVWKMYDQVYHENNGMYILIRDILNLDSCDESGKVNEFSIALDDVNKKIKDVCTTYVAALDKSNKQS